jgi:hypothetical protein
MNELEPQEVRTYRFKAEGLDPITVYVEQYAPGRSRVIIRCYARAWTAFWGAHGDGDVERFFVACNNDYLADNLAWGFEDRLLKQHKKRDRQYLFQIIDAVRAHWSAA